jgi:hypothetical protein
LNDDLLVREAHPEAGGAPGKETIWPEERLQTARDRGQAKLAGLLEAVQADTALELEFAEASLAHR